MCHILGCLYTTWLKWPYSNLSFLPCCSDPIWGINVWTGEKKTHGSEYSQIKINPHRSDMSICVCHLGRHIGYSLSMRVIRHWKHNWHKHGSIRAHRFWKRNQCFADLLKCFGKQKLGWLSLCRLSASVVNIAALVSVSNKTCHGKTHMCTS